MQRIFQEQYLKKCSGELGLNIVFLYNVILNVLPCKLPRKIEIFTAAMQCFCKTWYKPEIRSCSNMNNNDIDYSQNHLCTLLNHLHAHISVVNSWCSLD